MPLNYEPFLKWIWIPAVTLLGGSYEARLKGKVSKDTCKAIHTGIMSKFDDLKNHVDQRFDDHEKFYSKQIDRVIREVKKNNNGG